MVVVAFLHVPRLPVLTIVSANVHNPALVEVLQEPSKTCSVPDGDMVGRYAAEPLVWKGREDVTTSRDRFERKTEEDMFKNNNWCDVSGPG